MLNEQDVTAASDLLWRHWRDHTRIERLPQNLLPDSRRDAYRIQVMLASRSARGQAGWKVAATSAAGQAHINVDGPLAGRLLVERGFESGAELQVGNSVMKVAEPEFAFRFGVDLTPRALPFERDQVLGAVESLHPSIEIPDSRFEDFTAVGALQLIADNACAHEFVIGPAAAVDWRSLELPGHRVSIISGDGRRHDGVGANALGDPAEALTWLVNEVTSMGFPVSAGQVAMTGTCAVPMSIEPGDRIEADFGSLGGVAVSFRAG